METWPPEVGRVEDKCPDTGVILARNSGAGSRGLRSDRMEAWRNDWQVVVRATMVRRKAFGHGKTGPTRLETGPTRTGA